jgi:uncharacterized membrane protein (DUF4010 family)
MAGLAIVAYLSKVKVGRYGSTSEVALLLTFVIGALALLVDVWVSMSLGVVATLLLSEKAELEMYVERLDRVGFLATLKFILITVIIMPVLPDKEYTQFRLNPTRIWQIVVLVSAVGYVGYLLSKKFGRDAGLWMSGLIGGIVSSTAVSISAGRIGQKNPARGKAALQSALLAGSVMYLRVLVLVALLAPGFVPSLWWRLVGLAVIGFLLALTTRFRNGAAAESESPELQNPFEIRPSMLFALLFVALSIFTALIKQRMGDAGTIGLALLVGVVDVDPYVLSMLQSADVQIGLVTSAIILATMSNTLAKGVYFSSLASSVRREALLRYVAWGALHLPFVLF